jgi:hypothetical protein
MIKHLRIATALMLMWSFPTAFAGELQKNSIRLPIATQNRPPNQSSRSLKEMRDILRSKLIGPAIGYSYVCLIPSVVNDLNTRTNLGLNNFSTASLVSGPNPDANVQIQLFDIQGNLAGTGNYVVGSNALLQILNIIPSLGSNISVGWLVIFSDEPLTAWASVINNSTNDPSIELAIADQIGKPVAYLESTGNRLMIQSTTNIGKFQSSLSVVNVGSEEGLLMIKIYDYPGNLVTTETASVPVNGMYVNNNIRGSSYGPIIIEVTDPNSNNSTSPRIIANSLVRSTDQTGGFFPAFALPQADTVAVAGIWDGTILAGTLISAQVTLTLFQERDMIYGSLDINNGVFPTLFRGFNIAGEITNYYNFQVTDSLDQDNTFFVYSFIGSLQAGHLKGDTLYFDEKNRSAVGTFDLTRTGPIYTP